MRSIGQGPVASLIDKYNQLSQAASEQSNNQSKPIKSPIGEKVTCIKNAFDTHALNETAKYLLAKEALGQKVSQQTAKTLLEANKSINQTRETLFLGASNFKRSDDRPFYLTVASRHVTKNLPHQDQISARVAMSSTVGTGYCAEHATTSLLNHMPKLDEGDEIYLAMSKEPDHVWAEVKTKEGEIIVLDAWADGPTILLEDFASKDTRVYKIPLEHSYEELCHRKEENLAYIDKYFSSERWDQLIDKFRKNVDKSTVEFWDSEETTTEKFREESSKALNKLSDADKFMKKMNICRSLGASLKDSVATAEKDSKK